MRDFTTRLAKPPEAQPSRGACDFSTTACGARSAELADADTQKEPDTSRLMRSRAAERAISLQLPAERAARSWQTGCKKESDTSCGACAVSARREPRPAAPRSPRRSQLFHHLYHSSHHFAPAISALCSQAQYARFPASLLRSRQKCSRAAERANSLQLPAERAARSWQAGRKKKNP